MFRITNYLASLLTAAIAAVIEYDFLLDIILKRINFINLLVALLLSRVFTAYKLILKIECRIYNKLDECLLILLLSN